MRLKGILRAIIGGRHDSAETESADESSTESTADVGEQPVEGVDSAATRSARENNRTVRKEKPIDDESMILRLLVANGGQIKQSAIVAETGWSEEKTERVVGEMSADEQLTCLPRGGDTLVCRRGFEPAGSAPLFKSRT
jgi:hypothetical protein